MLCAVRAVRVCHGLRLPIPLNALRPHTCRRPVICRPLGRVIRPEQRPISTQACEQKSEQHTHCQPSHGAAPSSLWAECTGPRIPRGDRFSNEADRIEKQLLEDGHHVWGLAIYRCTYGNDAAWEKCLERLNVEIRDSMHFYNALDMLEEDRFRLTVFDDAAEFDAADVQAVRQHFKEWRTHALREEQGSREEIVARGGCTDPHFDFPGVRYRFCVQIGEAALQSIVSSEGEERAGEAWVNVIKGDWSWDPAAVAAQREQDKIWHMKMGLEPQDFEDCFEVFPEVDGCTEQNVGWMKVHYMALIPRFYMMLHDPSFLDDKMYVRPPEIANH